MSPIKIWNQGALPEYVDWDGKRLDGGYGEGQFRAHLAVEYEKGNRAESTTPPFWATATPPKVAVTTAPEYFSPDNDGVDDELTIGLQASSLLPFEAWSFEIRDPANGKRFWATNGKQAITKSILWDGRGNATPGGDMVESAMDYPYTFTVADTLGLVSKAEGFINVDVLVMRVGDVLKMRVPAIVFRSDEADFGGVDKYPKGGLTPEQIRNNERVLRRVATILGKFKEYTVTVEGHANNIGPGMNVAVAKSLSERRADFVRAFLTRNGVTAARLSSVGRGVDVPVVPLEDRDNWWKNRRVEFILNK
jgi:hypothetical protein